MSSTLRRERNMNTMENVSLSTSVFDEERSIHARGTTRSGLPLVQVAAIERDVMSTAWREYLTVTRDGKSVLYPMLASLRTLSVEFEHHLARTMPHITSAWNKVISGYRENLDLQKFLAVPGALRPWVVYHPATGRRVDFCRFDMVGGSIGTARIVEFNANCPGGVLFTSAFRRIWSEQSAVKELFDRWGVARDALHDGRWFSRLLFSSTGAANGDTVALFHQPGGNTLEIQKMRAILEEEGCRVVVTHPAANDWRDARAGYLKYGVQASLTDMGGWTSFLETISSGALPIVNPLPGRWIGDNKLCLAVLSDPRFHGLFSTSEREAIGKLIPLSRKAGDGIDPGELLHDRGAWVVKGPYDTQGRSVYVGAETDEDQWSHIVARAVREGWLVQETVSPYRITWNGRPAYQDLSVVWLRGRPSGYTSRISENFKVNVAQGGGRQMVFGNEGVSWVDTAKTG
jgi:hypothetical protein